MIVRESENRGGTIGSATSKQHSSTSIVHMRVAKAWMQMTASNVNFQWRRQYSMQLQALDMKMKDFWCERRWYMQTARFSKRETYCRFRSSIPRYVIWLSQQITWTKQKERKKSILDFPWYLLHTNLDQHIYRSRHRMHWILRLSALNFENIPAL